MEWVNLDNGSEGIPDHVTIGKRPISTDGYNDNTWLENMSEETKRRFDLLDEEEEQ